VGGPSRGERRSAEGHYGTRASKICDERRGSLQERAALIPASDSMPNLWQDLKFAVRMLRKNPGFTCVAVLTLALGVGANTTIFSVVHAVLLKPLPYPGAGRLVSLTASSFPKFTQIHDQTQTLEGIAAYYSFGSSLLTAQEPEAIQGAHVSLDFFRVLDVAPARGRAFLPEEEQTGGANVAILSDGFWRSHFAGDEGTL